MICYSVKANSNLAVIATLARLGAGADVVSEGEFRRALAAGMPGSRIIFSGVGKTEAELEFALAHDVRQINVESLPELELLSRGRAARWAASRRSRIRVNPDVDARTHAKITTGKKENKFGIDLAHAADALSPRSAACRASSRSGIAVHIGSQLTELAPFELAFARVVELYRRAARRGHRRSSASISAAASASAIATRRRPRSRTMPRWSKRLTDGLGVSLAFEPGRAIVGNAGVLVARVLYVKEGVTRRFVILDAAMNDLIRPALYDAWHEIRAAQPTPAPGAALAAGRPGRARSARPATALPPRRTLPPLAAGDLVALMSAGAYGAVDEFGLQYPPAGARGAGPGGRFAVIRQRPSYESVLAQDRLPPWLAER